MQQQSVSDCTSTLYEVQGKMAFTNAVLRTGGVPAGQAKGPHCVSHVILTFLWPLLIRYY